MTRTHVGALSLLLLLLATGLPLAAQDGDEGVTATVEIGGRAADAQDSPNLVSEYETDEGGVEIGIDWTADRAWGFLELEALYRDEDDQTGLLRWDWHRRIRSETTWNELPHRLLHDPLTNLAAATNHGRIVEHTDLDPDSIYGIRYSRLEHRTELQPSDRLQLALLVNNQEREGTRQIRTASHCSSCHVFGQDRPIDERNTDLGLEARYAWEKVVLRASYTWRELEQNPTFLTLLFDDALQPELQTPIFDNRLQWDSAQGPQPIDALPDVDKQVARIDLGVPSWGGVTFNASGVISETENRFTGLSSDYRALIASLARDLAGGWSLRWRGRAYEIDNDETFVDIAEPVAIAGPHLGRTYREVYGFDPDFVRLSALDRDVLESRFDATYELGGRRAGRLILSWDFDRTDRRFFAVTDDGETETTRNVLGVAWRGRPARRVQLKAGLRHGEIDHPFANPNGVFSTNTSVAVASPFAPQADQYADFQSARIGDATALPASFDELTLRASRSSAKSLLSASLRYWDGENDDGDLTDWAKTVQSGVLSYWAQPAPEWDWFVAYARHETEIESPASIPLFDG